MASMLYVEFCLIVRRLRQVLGTTALIVLVPPLISYASGKATTISLDQVVDFPVIAFCITMYFALSWAFAADEANGWEQGRLALPVTRRDMVRSRYLFLPLFGLGVLLFVAALTLLCAWLLPLLLPQASGELGLGSLLAFLLLSYLVLHLLFSLQLPLLFAWGASRARMIVVLPCLAPSLLSLLPEAALQTMGAGLAGVVGTLGWWLAPIGLLACAAVYLLSMQLSCRLYQRREL